MRWKYTYGPVPSRRLGHSLGVSVIPSKVCSYSCVYCQLGRTTHMQVRRESFFPRQMVLDEITEHLTGITADYITFVGDGEPTLSKDLGWLIKRCKANWNIPVAVITNGSLLFMDSVREDLMLADVVLPSLDAGSADKYRIINRPHRELEYDKVIEGLRLFRSEYRGQLWLEVMLVEGVNDGGSDLEAIRDRLTVIKPDRIYVMIPIRPPCESWVKPPPIQAVLAAQRILGEITPVLNKESGRFGLDGYDDAEQAIIEISSRHPLRRAQAFEIERALAATGELARLIDSGILRYVDYEGERYVLPRRLVNTTG